MLAINVDDMTSHETSNIKILANKLKYDYSLYTLRLNIRILTRATEVVWTKIYEHKKKPDESPDEHEHEHE
jgi:hypothetical protein